MKHLKILGMALFLALTMCFSSAAFAWQECNRVMVAFHLMPGWTMSGGSCNHGSYELRPNHISAFLEGTAFNGPDCTVNMAYHEGKVLKKQSSYHIQQNLCVAKAGKLTVNHLSGEEFRLEVHEGSFGEGMWGKVYLHPKNSDAKP